MASLGGDALLMKRLLTGLLAAGGGAAIYFGYKKWASRQLTAGDGKPDGASTGKKASAEAEKPDETKAEEDAEDVAKIDPTPVLQPEPLSSTNSSGNNDPESLSVSGTFEKVSLSTFQERGHESEDPALHSPSESFEKVSLPPSNNEASDLHSAVPTKTSPVPSTKSRPDADVSSPKTPASSASADVKKEPVKPEKETEVKSSSSIQFSKPAGLTSATKVTQSSDPKPAAKDLRKVESETGAQSARDVAEHRRGDAEDSKAASGKDVSDKEERKDEDGASDEEENEDEEEEEEGTSSDASADSQVKEDDGQATRRHETTPSSVGAVIRETAATTLGTAPRETTTGSFSAEIRETTAATLGAAPKETTPASVSAAIREGKTGTTPRETTFKSLGTGARESKTVTGKTETTTGSLGATTKAASGGKVNNAVGPHKSSQESRSSGSQSKQTDSQRNPEKLQSEKANSGSTVEKTDVSKTSRQKSHPTPDSGSPTTQSNDVHAEKNLEKQGSERAASDPDRTSSGSPGSSVLYDRRISATSLTDVENVNLTKEKLNRCMNRSSPVARNGHVFVGHPVHKDKRLDFGMRLGSGADKRHIVEWVDGDGLASECGVSVGDELLTVNNMPVTRWKSDVLLKLLSIINVTKFELTLSPNDDSLKTKGLIRHITINLTLDKKLVKVKPIIADMSSDYHLAPPIELGTLTPKCCFFGKPDSDTFLKLTGSDVAMAKKSEDTGPFEMMRLLFNRKNVKGYQPPVTMLAFCHNDIINYICTTDRNTLSLMAQSDLQTNVDSLDVADCRFFSHKFVAGCDCFESTQYPDHYLSCEGECLSLKYISNSKLLSQERSVHFKLHYRPVSQTTK